MATNEELAKILKELSEEELIEYFKKAGLNYYEMKKGARENEAFQKGRGTYQENKPLPESYRYPRR